LTTVP